MARLLIKNRQYLLRLLYRPDLYLGEAYSRGEVQVEGDLVKMLEYLAPLTQRDNQRRLWEKLKLQLTHLKSHTLTRSVHNIHHHYDISNDFYKLWLDKDLVYTCAYFPTKTASLEAAQQAKMEYVCRKLRLAPGETVVEAGCGWGALSRYMARNYGVKVRAYNISHEQMTYARKRTHLEGLAKQVEFIEEDYRAIKGRYDVFVSVGMLEHVGKARYKELGTVIDRSLNPHGRGLIHAIGRDLPMALNPWIERNIFPGAYPPTLKEMLEVLEPGGFSVQDVENLRPHYARTIEHWLSRYEENIDTVRQMFGETFVRSWRFYLACSIAGFNTSWLQLFQINFTRAGLNSQPLTRNYLYKQSYPGESRGQQDIPESPAYTKPRFTEN